MGEAPTQAPVIGEDDAVLAKHLDATAALVEAALAKYKFTTQNAIVEASHGIIVVTTLMPNTQCCVYALGEGNQSFLVAQIQLRPDC
jgi:hypothetical protein